MCQKPNCAVLLESFINYLFSYITQGRFENLTQKQNPIPILAKIIQTLCMQATKKNFKNSMYLGLIHLEICFNICKVFKST